MPLLALLALCLFLAGCGVDTPDITIPTVAFGGPASGDEATFVVGGQTITVRQSGSASVSTGASSPLTYSGPLGCKGHYFTAHLTEHIRIFFRYSAHDAYMLIGTGQLYHFPGKPHRRNGQLVWSRAFPDRNITVLARCPRPR